MKNYIYQNDLIGKKQLRHILGWSFSNYNSMESCKLADELKYVGFRYATQAGISISIEDLKIPFTKNLMLEKANQDIVNFEKIYLKGKITDVERFQKIIDTWNLTSESLKEQIIWYFKNYDPLNSVYIMAFSGARGNLSQVRQLVGMRGLMSDPSGEIMNLPIKKNFREGLTITDYLMSGYGARKGIVDTALKTANSGYLTRRLIDVAQDILIRERDCLTNHNFLIFNTQDNFNKLLGRVLNKEVIDPITLKIIAPPKTQITSTLINVFLQKSITKIYVRSPLTCKLYRAICQQCYGWDLATENLIDVGEAIGILAGQSIGEPGTQLTMRTFHTGGIFTLETQQQVKSPANGIIRFSKFLETVVLRTNRGEEVLVSKNSGFLLLIPELEAKSLQKIEISRNTIIFPKNNQYVQKDSVLGEEINVNKQIKKEIKPIIARISGETIIPKIKTPINNLSNKKLIWLLSGKLYSGPLSSYVNFYSDHKLNKNSFIFRTKIVNNSSGKVIYLNKSQTLYRRNTLNKNNIGSIKNSTLFKLSTKIGNAASLLKFENLFYLMYTTFVKNKIYLKTSRTNQFACLLTNEYKTKTGGIIYYDWRILKCYKNLNLKFYFHHIAHCDIEFFYALKFYKPANVSQLVYRTMLWIEEETYSFNCEFKALFVRHGDFIAKNFEIKPKYFSKNSGLIIFKQKNNIVKTVTIQSGLIYEGKKFIKQFRKIYFPGERIFSNIKILSPSLCTGINEKNGNRLLISPIQLYEFSYKKKSHSKCVNLNPIQNNFEFKRNSYFAYKPNQRINSANSITLILNVLELKKSKFLKNNASIELKTNKNKNSILIQTFNQVNFNNYILPKLKYKDVKSCLLTQNLQFIDQYTVSAYLESLTLNSLEIVKFKINQNNIKQILLVSNENCEIVEKQKLLNNRLNDFVLNGSNINYMGKIIIENKNFFTIQKGRPYFFPNCRLDNLTEYNNLKYKFLPSINNEEKTIINKDIFLNNFDRSKISIEKNIFLNNFDQSKTSIDVNSKNCLEKRNNFCFDKLPLKIKLSKMFLKKNGKLYSCLIPRFIKKFQISSNLPFLSRKIIKNKYEKTLYLDKKKTKEEKKEIKKRVQTTLLLQSSQTISNRSNLLKLALVKFFDFPLKRTNKAIGLYSITEDFFEKDLNSVFCQNNQFLENGDTIGLLNLEKQITGDIVQGLPRIEEILEARKKKQIIKRIPTSQKKSLLTQKNSLDQNFEFRRLGSPIKENEKINPHKLLKVYFNYYGLLKPFFSDKQKFVKYARLIKNFEGSYKSFKKVQSFILNSVQSVYKSQGVNINDKHLEVIIKQMTTKVLITDEGDTPLLKYEIIDLYHIEYINSIMEKENKRVAYYLPLLFGISRAALNNPSFMSAASFQETTKVLTKAAIEGRIDWLRGLKENIIIGHLIPAGTGFRSYKNSFKKSSKILINKSMNS